MSVSQKQSRKLLADPDHGHIYHKLMKADCLNALTYLSAASMLLEDRLFDSDIRELLDDVLVAPEHIIPAHTRLTTTAREVKRLLAYLDQLAKDNQ
ncbi:hypothetical protein QPC17_00270 [Trueperella bernardiae]|uniref:hypothetical protein n=1 Tax=Trueperella bernardiae TaxID=59561 RepID=UPI0025573E72|nr:hypothetical protein [Trueperella bernardiae]WIM08017.1 hypothetical protein QPC17_00270 [Trueperella bernardiae]